eukprot:g45913.t1
MRQCAKNPLLRNICLRQKNEVLAQQTMGELNEVADQLGEMNIAPTPAPAGFWKTWERDRSYSYSDYVLQLWSLHILIDCYRKIDCDSLSVPSKTSIVKVSIHVAASRQVLFNKQLFCYLLFSSSAPRSIQKNTVGPCRESAVE